MPLKMPSKKPIISLFLDSGAFSAAKNNTELPLQPYIDFLHKNLKWITLYANMDDLNDPIKTMENQKEMEKQGLNPLPVYHTAENRKYLERLVEQYNFIGIGGFPCNNLEERKNYFTAIFKIIIEVSKSLKQEPPLVHGFGVGNLDLIHSFPWCTVDATSWCRNYKYFPIFIRVKEGESFKDYKIWDGEAKELKPWEKDEIFEATKDGDNIIFPALQTKRPFIYYGTRDQPSMYQSLAIFQIKRHLLSYWTIRNKPKDWLKNYVYGHWPRYNYFLYSTGENFYSQDNMLDGLVNKIRRDTFPDEREIMQKKIREWEKAGSKVDGPLDEETLRRMKQTDMMMQKRVMEGKPIHPKKRPA
jgi:hypothetical protein